MHVDGLKETCYVWSGPVTVLIPSLMSDFNCYTVTVAVLPDWLCHTGTPMLHLGSCLTFIHCNMVEWFC